MNKILLLISMLLLLASCSSGLASKAEEKMKEEILKEAKDPESVKISDIEVIYNNDSLAVLQCVVRAKNSFGGYARAECEYYYVRRKEVKDGELTGEMEELGSLHDIGKVNPIKKDIKKIREENPEETKGQTEEELAFKLAEMSCILSRAFDDVKSGNY